MPVVATTGIDGASALKSSRRRNPLRLGSRRSQMTRSGRDARKASSPAAPSDAMLTVQPLASSASFRKFAMGASSSITRTRAPSQGRTASSGSTALGGCVSFWVSSVELNSASTAPPASGQIPPLRPTKQGRCLTPRGPRMPLEVDHARLEALRDWRTLQSDRAAMGVPARAAGRHARVAALPGLARRHHAVALLLLNVSLGPGLCAGGLPFRETLQWNQDEAG